MIGAIVGDVAGSRFEWHNVKKRPGNILDSHCFMTDDSLMTIAVAKAIVENKDRSQLGKDCIYWMQKIGRPRPSAGWGGQFKEWLYTDDPQPYNSLGNGSAMRVSAVAWAAQTLDECISMSKAVTEISHNHPEGIKGAEAIAVATFMALHGSTKDEIRAKMQEYYNLDFTLNAIRPFYKFDATCMGTVPPAIVAFLEATGFESAIRNAISIGGDSDTLAACTGAIAEAFFGVPEWTRERLEERWLRGDLREIIYEFEKVYPPKLA